MTADSLINPGIPVLKPTDLVQDALDLMDEYKYNALPVVSGTQFIGMVQEGPLLEALPNETLSAIELNPQDHFVKINVHFYELVKIICLYPNHIVAVLDEDNNYAGAISSHEILQYYANIGFINSPGGILVLSVPQQNYSLAEISRIVESNDMKVLASYISGQLEQSYNVLVTLKLNKTDLTRLVASFERYGYTVAAQFHESELRNTDEERLHHLLKYLSI